MADSVAAEAATGVKGMLSVDELRDQVERGTIDTVLTCFTDMQGRLEGKRIDGDFFLDYHILATTFDENVVGDIRRGMKGAGIPVEFTKGEAWPGQHELNFRFADSVTTADRHSIYKNGAKEIAHKHGQSMTFMAKPDHTWIGNSCHIHSSLWDPEASRSLFPGENDHEPSDVFNYYLGGLIAHMRELSIFLAPNVNSYKRYASESWAPTTLAWSRDNRTCGFRIVGHGNGFRIESRIPGADCNPYLAFAAMIAAGLHGLENGIEPPPMFEGNAYAEETLDSLDGILFSGGSDIDPEAYGAERHPETNEIRPDRDRAELALLRAALDRDMPVLAICRGSQVMNVARAGDLVQHLPEIVGDDKHKHTPG